MQDASDTVMNAKLYFAQRAQSRGRAILLRGSGSRPACHNGRQGCWEQNPEPSGGNQQSFPWEVMMCATQYQREGGGSPGRIPPRRRNRAVQATAGRDQPLCCSLVPCVLEKSYYSSVSILANYRAIVKMIASVRAQGC